MRYFCLTLPVTLQRKQGLGGYTHFTEEQTDHGVGLKLAFPIATLPPTLPIPTLSRAPNPSFTICRKFHLHFILFACLFVFASIAKSSICPLMVLSNERVTDNIRGGRALQVRLGDLILHLGVASAHDTHGDPCKAYSFN